MLPEELDEKVAKLHLHLCAALLAIGFSRCRAPVLALVTLVMGSFFGAVSDLSQQLTYSFLEEEAVLRDQTVLTATVISSFVSTRTQSKGMDSGSEVLF